MNGFVSQENNRINYKNMTYRRISYEMNDWKEYLELTWTYFENEKVKLDNWLKENHNQKDVQLKDKLSLNINYRYPHIHLSSIFVKIYIIAETEIGSFCQFYQNHFNVILSNKDGEYIKQKQDNYYWFKALCKASNISIGDFEPEYGRLLLFKKIRDSLSHNKENVILSKPTDDAFRRFLQKSEGLVLTDSFWVQEGALHKYFFVSDRIIIDLYNTIDVLFKKILDRTYSSNTHKLLDS